jgi:hypothetical protein
MTPNQDQYLMLVRAVMLIAGPLLISHGVNSNDLATLSSGVEALVGAALTVGPIVWGMFAHTQAAALKQAAAIPAVQEIKVDTKQLADAIPSDKVVHAP